MSKVKTGLNSFKDIKLPISESSLAGFCALHKRHMNIRDVYDDAELKQFSPNLAFLKAVDQRTGYRSKQMLIAPILGGDSGTELMGVLQLINNLSGQPFSSLHDEGVIELAKTLAIAFRVRQQMPGQIASKFEYLVIDSIIQAGELDLATKAARRKNKTVEDILIDEFQVKKEAIGDALAKFFGVEYEPHKADRIKPIDLLKNLKREYCVASQWIPLEDTKQGILVMATDPERVRNSRMVDNVFPRAKIVYKVTTSKDFEQALTLFFGGAAEIGGGSGESIGDLLSSLDDEEEPGSIGADDVSAAADNELVKLVNKIIVDAYNQGASDIHVEPLPGKGKTGVRFRKDGSLSNYIEVPASYRQALVTRLKIMCDLDISEKRRPQDGKIKFKKFGPLDIELRVATIPTAGGVEDVVMRILAAGEPIPLDKLGVLPQNLETLKECVSKPYGLFFVCGPTGSGKTTTLHSVLGFLNTVGHQDLDGGGPGRNHAEGPAPVPGEPQGGVHLRHRHEGVPARGPRHHHGRGNARQGHHRDRHRGFPHGPPRVRDPAHEQRAGVDHPPARHGHGPLQLRRRAAGHPRAAPGQAAVQVQGDLHAHRRRAQALHHRVLRGAAQHRGVQEGPERRLQGRLRPLPEGLRLRQARVRDVQGQGLRHLRRLRLQGPRRPARAAWSAPTP